MASPDIAFKSRKAELGGGAVVLQFKGCHNRKIERGVTWKRRQFARPKVLAMPRCSGSLVTNCLVDAILKLFLDRLLAQITRLS